MGIGQKAGRVAQLFGGQRWDSFISELLRFRFSLLMSALCRLPHLLLDSDQLGA
jgi:hypothetical protein